MSHHNIFIKITLVNWIKVRTKAWVGKEKENKYIGDFFGLNENL